MLRRMLKGTGLVVVVVFLCIASFAWGSPEKGKVTSEPLNCYTQDEQTVCFDGKLTGKMTCEVVDVDLVLCTEQD